MGYTHYFYVPSEIEGVKWDILLQKVEKLYNALQNKSIIKGGLGEGKPEFTQREIWFNGDRSANEDGETFLLEQAFVPSEFDKRHSKNNFFFKFCKTNRRPYDFFVCLVLIAMRQSILCKVGSDGKEKDWEEAIVFYNKTMGTNVTFSDIVER